VKEPEANDEPTWGYEEPSVSEVVLA
jgi:hypothetical protein